MNIKDIKIIGVTNQAIDNNPKTTAFVYESEDKTQYGLVYFTGAYWSVSPYNGVIEQSLKEKLRRKVSNCLPDAYKFIEDPIFYFHNKNYFIKESSEAQRNLIVKLISSCPSQLYSVYASDIINGFKIYDGCFVKKDLFFVNLNNKYDIEKENIIHKMTDFIKVSSSIDSQFEFIKQFGVVMNEINELIDIARKNSISSIKIK